MNVRCWLNGLGVWRLSTRWSWLNFCKRDAEADKNGANDDSPLRVGGSELMRLRLHAVFLRDVWSDLARADLRVR